MANLIVISDLNGSSSSAPTGQVQWLAPVFYTYDQGVQADGSYRGDLNRYNPFAVSSGYFLWNFNTATGLTGSPDSIFHSATNATGSAMFDIKGSTIGGSMFPTAATNAEAIYWQPRDLGTDGNYIVSSATGLGIFAISTATMGLHTYATPATLQSWAESALPGIPSGLTFAPTACSPDGLTLIVTAWSPYVGSPSSAGYWETPNKYEFKMVRGTGNEFTGLSHYRTKLGTAGANNTRIIGLSTNGTWDFFEGSWDVRVGPTNSSSAPTWPAGTFVNGGGNSWNSRFDRPLQSSSTSSSIYILNGDFGYNNDSVQIFRYKDSAPSDVTTFPTREAVYNIGNPSYPWGTSAGFTPYSDPSSSHNDQQYNPQYWSMTISGGICYLTYYKDYQVMGTPRTGATTVKQRVYRCILN